MPIKKTIPKQKSKTKEKPVVKGKYESTFNKRHTEGEIIKIGDELVDYFINNKNALHITNFTSEKLIHRQRFYDWAEKYPYFQQCMDIVRDIIIRRIFSLGFVNKNAVFPIFALINISNGEFTNERTKQTASENIPPVQIEIISNNSPKPDNTESE